MTHTITLSNGQDLELCPTGLAAWKLQTIEGMQAMHEHTASCNIGGCGATYGDMA